MGGDIKVYEHDIMINSCEHNNTRLVDNTAKRGAFQSFVI